MAQFVAPMEMLPYGAEAAQHYGRLRAFLEKKGTPIGSLDMLIAAHVLSINCILVTNNENEFRRIPTLKIDNWIKWSLKRFRISPNKLPRRNLLSAHGQDQNRRRVLFCRNGDADIPQRSQVSEGHLGTLVSPVDVEPVSAVGYGYRGAGGPFRRRPDMPFPARPLGG